MNGIRTFLNHYRATAIATGALAVLAGTAIAAFKIFQHPVNRDGRETRMNVIVKVPYGSASIMGGAGPNQAALIESESDDPDDQPSLFVRYLYNPVGTIGTLRVTLGSDGGMLERPKEFASGSLAASGFRLASAGNIETDGGTRYVNTSYNTNSTSNAEPLAPMANDNSSVSRVFLNPTIPLSFYGDFGFGESLVDLTGLSVLNTTIQTSASKTKIVSRSVNPVGMDNCNINAGLGECEVDGICNFNCKAISFSGGIGYYELHFNGSLQRDLDATVEIGCGKVVINIPPNSAKVVVDYDDNLFSSFSFEGLNKRRDGVYTSPGFDNSFSPTIRLHLSTGVGKMIVSYR